MISCYIFNHIQCPVLAVSPLYWVVHSTSAEFVVLYLESVEIEDTVQQTTACVKFLYSEHWISTVQGFFNFESLCRSTALLQSVHTICIQVICQLFPMPLQVINEEGKVELRVGRQNNQTESWHSALNTPPKAILSSPSLNYDPGLPFLHLH